MKFKYKKALIISLALILVISTVKSVKKGKIEKMLVKANIIERCYDLRQSWMEVFEQEGIDYCVSDDGVIRKSAQMLQDTQISNYAVPTIPFITHKIYMTTNDNNKLLSEFDLAELASFYNKMNSLGIKWQHIFWTNKPSLLSEEVKKIDGVIIKDIALFEYHPVYKSLLSLINKAQKNTIYFIKASDLVRYLALQKFGGIYSDIDYEVFNPELLLEMIRKYDFIGGREHTTNRSYYGSAFVVAKPNHPIINEALDVEASLFASDKSKIPKYLKYSCYESNKFTHGGPFLVTLAFFRKNNLDNNRDIILPAWMIYNSHFIHYKNGTCSAMGDSFNRDSFNKRNTKIAELLQSYSYEGPKPKISVHHEDIISYYSNHYHGNIDKCYTNDNHHTRIIHPRDLPVIGGDMFCAKWISNLSKKKYYLKNTHD